MSVEKNILVTGGSGFIGSAFCRFLHRSKKFKIIILDKLTYASNKNSINEILEDKNVKFFKGSIGNKTLVQDLLKSFTPTYIVNFAAETHVDNSISNPDSFIQTNIVDTHNFFKIILNFYKDLNKIDRLKFRFLQISTDEVYGDIDFDKEPVNETAPYRPSSPYSATKAAGDHLVKAYFRTFDFPGIISNCSNNYGPFQHHEKFIPKVITSVLNKKKIPIYGNGKQVRDWIYVDDHCNALIDLINNGQPGENYNIGNGNEITNIDVVKTILTTLKSFSLINNNNIKHYVNFVDDRLGHDRRYSIDSTKIRKLSDWKSKTNFETGIELTISSMLQIN